MQPEILASCYDLKVTNLIRALISSDSRDTLVNTGVLQDYWPTKVQPRFSSRCKLDASAENKKTGAEDEETVAGGETHSRKDGTLDQVECGSSDGNKRSIMSKPGTRAVLTQLIRIGNLEWREIKDLANLARALQGHPCPFSLQEFRRWERVYMSLPEN